MRGSLVLRLLWRACLGLVALSGVAAAGFGFWWYVQNRDARPSEYHERGAFGPVVEWPIMPIHVVLLPDGRVMNYGSDGKGIQGASSNYDVWDPSKGTGPESHLMLPNGGGTDLFCTGQVVLPYEDSVLMAGGDVTVNGVRNYSSPAINFFDYKKNVLISPKAVMQRPRWYPTLVTLSNGDVFIAGGRIGPDAYLDLPEIYSTTKGWSILKGAKSEEAFGRANWDYPLSWQAPNGKVFVTSVQGPTFYVDPTGDGSIERTSLVLPWSAFYMPAVMYEPGKILMTRKRGKTALVDLNGDVPTARESGLYGIGRVNSNATVMADGKVLLSGGSFSHNQDRLVNYGASIWDPATEQWSRGPSSKRMRLYHSVALLLPDATVLTGGGGADGPQTNLNVEIYYPPYLFKPDGSGEKVTRRPAIVEAPHFLSWGQEFTIKASEDVSRVTLVKTGAVTHTANFDQRFMTLPHQSKEGVVTLKAPPSSHVAPPGNYMLFVFDRQGVPSVARILKLG
jgi:hypothetical protein